MMEISQDERFSQELAGRFAREHVREHAAAIDAEDRFPAELLRQAAQLGIVGMALPEEVGGAGLSHVAFLLALEEVATASATLANILMVQGCYAEMLTSIAPQEIQDKWVPAVLAGERVLSIAVTEPDAGSDVRAITTTAVEVDGGWRITGTKQWITLAGVSDAAIVLARSGISDGKPTFDLFFVEADRPGYRRADEPKLMGMRGEATGSLVLDGVVVPASHRLGPARKGLRTLMASFDYGRLAIAALAIGIGRRACEEAVSYATQREAFGQPIGEFQGVSFPIADMHTALTAARLVLLDAARRMDRGERYSVEASMAKLLASDAAAKASSDAVLLHGGMGYSTELPVERLMREAKLTQIYEGTNNIQRMLIARSLLS
jgi:alkylation response protein AidB-like acyl-CoA dehydrogenase